MHSENDTHPWTIFWGGCALILKIMSPWYCLQSMKNVEPFQWQRQGCGHSSLVNDTHARSHSLDDGQMGSGDDHCPDTESVRPSINPRRHCEEMAPSPVPASRVPGPTLPKSPSKAWPLTCTPLRPSSPALSRDPARSPPPPAKRAISGNVRATGVPDGVISLSTCSRTYCSCALPGGGA